MKKKRNIIRLTVLAVLVVIALIIDWPGGIKVDIPAPIFKSQKSFPFFSATTKGSLFKYNLNLNINQGLDLQGGSHLVYIADLSKLPQKDRADAMASLQKVIENRVNAFGVAEPLVYTSQSGGENRVTVELAGVKDTNSAMDLIGKTADLEFRDNLTYENPKGDATGLTGKDLKSAAVAFDQNTGAPYISMQFTSEGAKKFETITGRNVGKPLGISLDGEIIQAPNVQQQISGGSAQITGKYTYIEAKNLSIQLNAGRLPVPIKIAEQRTVEASLGQSSVKMSVIAGLIGIIIVSLFMIIYYRVLGIFSTIGLGLYLIFTLALFKIFGITLTMGGIAGLILSIGMSMETDVLVFERIREEMRNGRNFAQAANLGFNRAWPSIKDANIVSLIICVLLIWAGGMIRGFAIVLALGIIVGILTTFLGTRALIELIMYRKFARNNTLFNVEKEDDND
ncbi:MAG: protein translocase subunit SecD [bacterium]